MSLLTSFDSGVSGLHAAQSGLNTTAHNIGNTKTPGYSRQQNIQKDIYYQDFKVTDKGKMQVGYGTAVAEIRQIRDLFLDREYRVEGGRAEFYNALHQTGQEVEDILGEMEGVEFNQALQKLWEDIEAFSTDLDSITEREVFIAQSEAFLEKAKNAYQSLRDYQVNLNDQIVDKISQVNKMADQIADLNFKIASAEASGMENANDFRDQRNLLMDQLSKITPFEYNEDVNKMVIIRINNAPLVEGTKVNHWTHEKLSLDEFDPASNSYTKAVATEFYNVIWERGGYDDVYKLDQAYSSRDDSDIGSLPGILTARGRKYGYYTDIPMRQDYIDDTDYGRAVKKFNNTTGNCLLEKVEAQFDLLVHKVVTAINDVLAPNVEISADSGLVDENGNDVSSFSNTDGVGIDFTSDANGNPVIELTRQGSTKTYNNIHVLDAFHCPVAADDQTIGMELFVRRTEDGERYHVFDVSGPLYMTDAAGNQIEITQRVEQLDANGKVILDASNQPVYDYKLYVYREEDPEDVNSLYTLQNLEVNQKILENYSYLPVKRNPETGEYGGYQFSDMCLEMLNQWKKQDTMLDPNALTEYGANEFYEFMVGSLATQTEVWYSKVVTQESMTNSIEDKRQQQSGVATDEEMIALLMYQHAYNAASRYISVIDDMLEHLIMRLG